MNTRPATPESLREALFLMFSVRLKERLFSWAFLVLDDIAAFHTDRHL